MKKKIISVFSRKRLYSAVLVASIVPFNIVNALGLGDIEVKSGLNEYLNASIEIFKSDEDNLENFYAYFTNKEHSVRSSILLGYDIVLKLKEHNNKTYLHLTSKKFIKDPMISFNILLGGNNSRLVKKVNLFLTPKLIKRTPKKSKKTRNPINTKQTIAKQTSYQYKPDNQAIAYQKAFKKGDIAKKDYPVKKGDSMWKIANMHQVVGLSIMDTIHLIYENNPHAFVNNNMDRLKSDTVLSIPSHTKTSQAKNKEEPPAELNPVTGNSAGVLRLATPEIKTASSKTQPIKQNNSTSGSTSVKPIIVDNTVVGLTSAEIDNLREENKKLLLKVKELLLEMEKISKNTPDFEALNKKIAKLDSDLKKEKVKNKTIQATSSLANEEIDSSISAQLIKYQSAILSVLLTVLVMLVGGVFFTQIKRKAQDDFVPNSDLDLSIDENEIDLQIEKKTHSFIPILTENEVVLPPENSPPPIIPGADETDSITSKTGQEQHNTIQNNSNSTADNSDDFEYAADHILEFPGYVAEEIKEDRSNFIHNINEREEQPQEESLEDLLENIENGILLNDELKTSDKATDYPPLLEQEKADKKHKEKTNTVTPLDLSEFDQDASAIDLENLEDLADHEIIDDLSELPFHEDEQDFFD